MMPILQPLAVPHDCVIDKGSISLAEEFFTFSVTELQPCSRSLRMVNYGNGQIEEMLHLHQLSASERHSLATSRYSLSGLKGRAQCTENARTISSPFRPIKGYFSK